MTDKKTKRPKVRVRIMAVQAECDASEIGDLIGAILAADAAPVIDAPMSADKMLQTVTRK